MRAFLLLTIAVTRLAAQTPKSALVITAGSGDYLMAAGGTLASLADRGYAIYVLQIANDEKNSSSGLSPAETRLANTREGEEAGRMIGVREVVNLNHKSGELSQVSSNEIRNQIFALVRYFKPEIVFHPDPWVHYEPEWDQFWTARAAEEFSYGSSNYFLAEIGRMGFPAWGVAETYYYAPKRPYRPGEGGHNAAKFRAVDIGPHFNRKVAAIQQLRTANRLYAEQTKLRLEFARRPSARLEQIDEASVRGVVRAYVEELAETIGKKHRFQYGEEFNWHGRGDPVPAHVRERAKPLH